MIQQYYGHVNGIFMYNKTYRNDFFQEIFDKVAKHLLTQNKKAANEKGQCKYRFNDLKCAAGCLIPDSDYDKKYEDKTVYSFSYFENAGYSDDEICFIRDLQIIHDKDPVSSWKSHLIDIAKQNKLAINFE